MIVQAAGPAGKHAKAGTFPLGKQVIVIGFQFLSQRNQLFIVGVESKQLLPAYNHCLIEILRLVIQQLVLHVLQLLLVLLQEKHIVPDQIIH